LNTRKKGSRSSQLQGSSSASTKKHREKKWTRKNVFSLKFVVFVLLLTIDPFLLLTIASQCGHSPGYRFETRDRVGRHFAIMQLLAHSSCPKKRIV
jgi:hypothetical protein